MRISDWSSDVCSSDLVTYGYSSQATIETVIDGLLANGGLKRDDVRRVLVPNVVRGADDFASGKVDAAFFAIGGDRKSAGSGKSGSVRVDLGGRSDIKKTISCQLNRKSL